MLPERPFVAVPERALGRRAVGRTDEQTDGRTDGRAGGRADGQIEERTDRRTDRRTGGRMDRPGQVCMAAN